MLRLVIKNLRLRSSEAHEKDQSTSLRTLKKTTHVQLEIILPRFQFGLMTNTTVTDGGTNSFFQLGCGIPTDHDADENHRSVAQFIIGWFYVRAVLFQIESVINQIIFTDSSRHGNDLGLPRVLERVSSTFGPVGYDIFRNLNIHYRWYSNPIWARFRPQ